MSQEHDFKAKALYTKYKTTKVAQSLEIADGVIADYDENGGVVGIEVLNVQPSKAVDTGQYLNLATRKTPFGKKSSPPQGDPPPGKKT